MIDFDYILCGYEVDEYCDILINKYGENSDIVQKLDKRYDQLRKSSHIWVDQLNAIRHFLVDKGFDCEIAYADEVFADIIEKRIRETSPYSGLTVLELRQKQKEKTT